MKSHIVALFVLSGQQNMHARFRRRMQKRYVWGTKMFFIFKYFTL